MKINKRKASIIVIVFILLLFLGSAFLAYGSGSSIGLVSRIKGVYPAVIVGSKGISVREYEETIAAAKSLPNFNKKQAYEQMIKHRKTEVFLERKNLGLSPEDLAKETKFLTSDKAEYQKLLQSNFHNDSNLFRNSVVYPLTLEAKAKIYYSSQNSLHNDEYKEANDTLEKVKTDAASFNDLAQQVSDDKFSAQFGGDLGFFQEGQIIPELESAILKAELGKVHPNLIVSRYGYHIIYPLTTSEKDGKKVWQAKHILIEVKNFDTWLEKQTKDINVIRIVKPD